MKKYVINLFYKSSLDWKTLLKFFLMHQIIGVEQISENSFERSFKISNSVGFFKIANQKTKLILELLLSNPAVLPLIEQKVRKMFDLDIDLELLTEKFQQHPLLKNVYAKYPALRIPGGWNIFETSINTIISQSISIIAARKLLAKLVISYGEQIVHPISKEKIYLFPDPEALVKADLTNFGVTNMKKAAIQELSKKVIKQEIDLESYNDEELKTNLLKIKGIGHWTAEYVGLRCSKNKDAFPKGDLILKRYIEKGLDIREFVGIKSYLAIYLWQHHLIFEQNQKK